MEVIVFTGFSKSMPRLRHFVEHLGVVVVKISSSVLRVAGAGVGGGAAVVAGSGMVGTAVDVLGARLLLTLVSVTNRIRKHTDIIEAFTQEYYRVSYPQGT